MIFFSVVQHFLIWQLIFVKRGTTYSIGIQLYSHNNFSFVGVFIELIEVVYIYNWPTKLKLLWECNWIPIQFVVPLFTKIKCFTGKYCREKKIINFFLSQMSTSRLILYFLYLDKNPVRFVSALKKLICNVYWSIVLLIEGVKYGKNSAINRVYMSG